MGVPSVVQTSPPAKPAHQQTENKKDTSNASNNKVDAPDSPTGVQSFCPSIASNNNSPSLLSSSNKARADLRAVLADQKKPKEEPTMTGSTRSMPGATPPLKSTFVRKGAKTTMVTKQKDGSGDEFFISISFNTEAAAKATAAEEERLRESYHAGTQRRPFGTAADYEYLPYGVTVGATRRRKSAMNSGHVGVDDDGEHDDAEEDGNEHVESGAQAMDEEMAAVPPSTGGTAKESSPLFGKKTPSYYALPSQGDEEEGMEVVAEFPPSPFKTPLPATPSTTASSEGQVVVQKERRLSAILLCFVVTATILLGIIAFVIFFRLRLRNDGKDDGNNNEVIDQDAFVESPPSEESSSTDKTTLFSASTHEDD